MNWLVLQNGQELPQEWDGLAGKNIFLTRSFLQHLEKVNPCQQKYNLLYNQGNLKAIYVDYSLNLDIFTYSFLKLKIPVRIMGIPCSVSKQGFAISADYEGNLIKHFHSQTGAKLILNSTSELPSSQGQTLPSCELVISWRSFNQYLQSLRSNYRYRIKKILKKWSQVQVEFIEPAQFNYKLYQLYENVFENSQVKLEKLNRQFFQKMPLPSLIIQASYRQERLGFVQLVQNGQELIFLFTGFNYQLNNKFAIYLNLLLEIVRYGINNKFKVIDFGQTAEESKLKLGCKLKPKNMYISHSNFFLNKLINKYSHLLSYQTPNHNFKVFK